MKLQGEHLFGVTRQQLWEALLDPGVLVRVLPGCEPLEATGPSSWRAAMTVRVGPVAGRFAGTLALSDLAPPESYRLRLDGSGPAGFLRGEGRIELVESGETTLLRYEVDAQVGGRVAAVGQRLVESSGRALAKQGLEGLERELAARAPAAAAGAVEASAPAGGAPPSTAAFAARFARGLWRELPASWRIAGVTVAAALVAALLLLARAC